MVISNTNLDFILNLNIMGISLSPTIFQMKSFNIANNNAIASIISKLAFTYTEYK